MSKLSRCKPLLGTFVEIAVAGDDSYDALLARSAAAFAEIDKVDSAMSFHRADSELTYINTHAARERCAISESLEYVLRFALRLSAATNGLFDVTIAPRLVASGLLPDPGIVVSSEASWKDIELTSGSVRFAKPLLIDLGGIAKGYAVDRASAALGDDVEAVVNAGGDLRMHPWQGQQALLRFPHPPSGASLVAVAMESAALATTARRPNEVCHCIIAPPTGKPAVGAESISVFASSCMLADALTKVACLSNDERLLQRLGATRVLSNGIRRCQTSVV